MSVTYEVRSSYGDVRGVLVDTFSTREEAIEAAKNEEAMGFAVEVVRIERTAYKLNPNRVARIRRPLIEA